MKKFVWALAGLMMSAVLVGTPSQATARAVDDGECWRVGTTNAFANANEPINLDMIYTFPEYRCNIDRIRVYKAYADNRPEVRALRSFAESNDKVYFKMAFCRTSETEAHILDLAWFYFQWMEMREVEKEGYVPYLNAYAVEHDCRIY